MKPRVMSLVIFTCAVGLLTSPNQIPLFDSLICIFFVTIGAGAAGTLNAELVIETLKNRKILSINEFFISYRKTKLKKGEFIYSIRIPLYKNNIFKAYKISKRFDDDISSLCASSNMEINNNKIKNIFIAFGGMAEIPKRAKICEKSLKNKHLSIDVFLKARNYLEKDFNPIDDMRASKNYRLEVAKNLLIKCFHEIKSKKLLRVN